MLGDDILKNSPEPKKRQEIDTQSVNTSSAMVEKKIEEEIQEEIKLAQEKLQKNKRNPNEDLVEDFESISSGKNSFTKNSNGSSSQERSQRTIEEDQIVDEIGEDEDLKLIDEEIMNSQVGKQDARKLKDLIGKMDEALGEGQGKEQIVEAKKTIDSSNKFSSSSKVIVSKYNKSSSKTNLHDNINKNQSNSIFGGHTSQQMPVEPKYKRESHEVGTNLGVSSNEQAPEQVDEIDEFIQKHLEDDEEENEHHEKLTAKAKAMLGENSMKEQDEKESQDMLEESLSDSEVSGSFDSEQLTPKQSLLNGLIRLGDPKTKKYSLTEREHFVFDLENILKVLTFKETVAYIFPVLDVYAAEQEYLKIELFRQIPNVFKKLMKSPARPSDQDSLDLLTVNIFPLISQILMTSEDQVQTEGVKALHQISVDYLPRDEATFLVFNVVQLLIKKSDQIENAKIAVLMLIEKFAESDFFEKKECMNFLENSMDSFLDGALFKIKKQILPCLLATAKHIDYMTFQQKVIGTYQKFARDPIWGVRRVAIEFMPEVIKKLKPNETDRICKCLDALKLAISDESKWVKN